MTLCEELRAIARQKTMAFTKTTQDSRTIAEVANAAAVEIERQQAALQESKSFHICAGDKIRPYPTVLCSCALRHSDTDNFDVVETLTKLRADNQRMENALHCINLYIGNTLEPTSRTRKIIDTLINNGFGLTPITTEKLTVAKQAQVCDEVGRVIRHLDDEPDPISRTGFTWPTQPKGD